MPHLCPTSWSAAFFSFWLIFFVMNTLIWWLQLPSFPHIFFPSTPHGPALWSWK